MSIDLLLVNLLNHVHCTAAISSEPDLNLKQAVYFIRVAWQTSVQLLFRTAGPMRDSSTKTVW